MGRIILYLTVALCFVIVIAISCLFFLYISMKVGWVLASNSGSMKNWGFRDSPWCAKTQMAEWQNRMSSHISPVLNPASFLSVLCDVRPFRHPLTHRTASGNKAFSLCQCSRGKSHTFLIAKSLFFSLSGDVQGWFNICVFSYLF